MCSSKTIANGVWICLLLSAVFIDLASITPSKAMARVVWPGSTEAKTPVVYHSLTVEVTRVALSGVFNPGHTSHQSRTSLPFSAHRESLTGTGYQINSLAGRNWPNRRTQPHNRWRSGMEYRFEHGLLKE